jgi:leucyl/phenylalanyl-tRNA--protein transferase
MFHRVTDASKAAVVATAGYVFADGDPRRLIDVQWATVHLRSLGVVTVSRHEYLERLRQAVDLAPPTFSA